MLNPSLTGAGKRLVPEGVPQNEVGPGRVAQAGGQDSTANTKLGAPHAGFARRGFDFSICRRGGQAPQSRAA